MSHVPAPAAAAPAPAPGWVRELVLRFRFAQVRKLVGISLFMWVFFSAYFHLLRHPAFPVTTMPLVALDAAVPFQPGALPVYLSLWCYVGIPAGLAASLREAAVYGLWSAALCLTALVCFYFWPSAVPPFALPPDAGAGFALLRGVDPGGNACPSLHVASALFAASAIDRLLRGIGAPALMRALSMAWFVAITWSTMAVRQHVALDVAGGLALGTLFALLQAAAARRPG